MNGREPFSQILFSRSGGADQVPARPFSFSVVWDGYGLGAAASGVGAYGRSLAQALKPMGISPVVLGSEQLVQGLPPELSGYAWRSGPEWLRKLIEAKPIWRERVGRLVADAAKSRVESIVLHGLSNFNLPRRALPQRVGTVLTVHDLIPLLVPQGVSKASYLQFKALVPGAMRRADRIVCVSHWTRRTIVERYPELEARLVVIPNGIDALAPESQPEASSHESRLRLLYVARGEGYKRLSVFLDILRHGRESWRGILVTDQRGYVMASKLGADLVSERTLEVKTGLSGEAYREIFHKTDVYVQPSLLEGFSLPAADALRFAKPVVYVGGSGTDEVVGTVGVRVQAEATLEEWSDAITRAKALAQSSQFSERLAERWREAPTWKDAASALATVYTQVI